MVKTPEEYFEDHLFDVVQAEPANSFTAAEAAFMSKYLGVNEAEALERLGLHKAVEPECVLSAVGSDCDIAAKVTSLPTVAVGASDNDSSQKVNTPSAFDMDKAEEPSAEKVTTVPEIAVAEPVQDEIANTANESLLDDSFGADTVTPVEEEDNWFGVNLEREPDLLEQLRNESELQMVSFFLGKQEFTVPISAVQEVIRHLPPTKLPVAPPFVSGVINLRGTVTPIIQLRELLGIAGLEEQGRSDKFIVVCKRHGLQFGLVIDTVHTMYRVPQGSIDWAVESHLGVAVQYIFGLMKSDDMLIGIISVDNIVEAILEG
ncbi:chemotaxis protein CheW [Halodesulfovibrio marinisediminis]|uniref:Chemotaxis signal transduction protein n=1 Tax=Halodesulfovibrio marinisediminis DSM 17456 TaxID=1121457 RepID=A0A1N6DIC3_9BACT|nr:chemotaxis protein CheW [Halodesulfovibrio marinisediminis]SIN70561.1 Chemotaxis signal transduction protein [Halodesulfovibrio marinisediminis DSM 17456]